MSNLSKLFNPEFNPDLPNLHVIVPQISINLKSTVPQNTLEHPLSLQLAIIPLKAKSPEHLDPVWMGNMGPGSRGDGQSRMGEVDKGVDICPVVESIAKVLVKSVLNEVFVDSWVDVMADEDFGVLVGSSLFKRGDTVLKIEVWLVLGNAI